MIRSRSTRANRVFSDKVNRLIVDYVGVFRDLQKALAIYGTGTGGSAKEGEMPVKDKSELVAALKQALVEVETYCKAQGVDAQAILATKAQDFQRAKMTQDAVDALIVNDEVKRNNSLKRNWPSLIC
jgi:type I restriction enzyme, R subunit